MSERTPPTAAQIAERLRDGVRPIPLATEEFVSTHAYGRGYLDGVNALLAALRSAALPDTPNAVAETCTRVQLRAANEVAMAAARLVDEIGDDFAGGVLFADLNAACEAYLAVLDGGLAAGSESTDALIAELGDGLVAAVYVRQNDRGLSHWVVEHESGGATCRFHAFKEALTLHDALAAALAASQPKETPTDE